MRRTASPDSVLGPDRTGYSAIGGTPATRIALYSHDAMGLGHMRRNVLIADALRRLPTRADVLLIAGAGELNAFRLPAGVDCVTLPALRKNQDGTYEPRRLRMLREELIVLRSNMIRAALEVFDPDIFMVDKLPRGLLRELEPVLRQLGRRRRTSLVLGLRDVLDDAAAVRRQWLQPAAAQAIRDYYDAIWVFGDPAVYDPVKEYGFPPGLAAKVRYTGYLDPRARATIAEDGGLLRALNLPPGRLALCQTGGGQDGGRLAAAFVNATLPDGMNGILLTGPFMPERTRRRLEERAARNPRLRVLDFVAEPLTLLNRSDRVIAMGGYNTLCEILSFQKPALIVPRVSPRREQLIRAQRFRDLGLLELTLPDRLTSEALSEWLASDLAPPAAAAARIDFGGVSRLPQLLRELLDHPRRASESPPLYAAQSA